MKTRSTLLVGFRAAAFLLVVLFQIPAYAQQEGVEAMNFPREADTMIVTILEANVEANKADSLQQMFASTGSRLPPQISQSFLVRNTSDETSWRIITIWRSREALSEYRSSVEIPEGILMFRKLGAEPSLSIFEMAESVMSKP